MSSLSCVRQALCCVNLLFWVLGCGMLGIGIWMHLAYQSYNKVLLSPPMLSGDSLVIVAGVLMFLLSFLGCCGSWFQNKCLLRMYFVMVIVILLLEFTAGILGFVYRKHVGNVLRDELLVGIQQRYTADNTHGLKDTWDHIQLQFSCCGVKHYDDWFHISAWPEKKWVPSSCCLPKFSNDTVCSQSVVSLDDIPEKDISFLYHTGCYSRLHVWLMERLYVVGVVSLVFAFVQVFGIISALVIVCSMGPKRR
ncbi:tetraspanin-9-like [Uloborus diversus]|uniref:tetraspanin-9-like n=1 Tax=Uloborus diversus TaxID=327109 RepID=UPI00240A6A0E|nr:tetraspanin-9-like [Uloborus diversus]